MAAEKYEFIKIWARKRKKLRILCLHAFDVVKYVFRCQIVTKQPHLAKVQNTGEKRSWTCIRM